MDLVSRSSCVVPARYGVVCVEAVCVYADSATSSFSGSACAMLIFVFVL